MDESGLAACIDGDSEKQMARSIARAIHIASERTSGSARLNHSTDAEVLRALFAAVRDDFVAYLGALVQVREARFLYRGDMDEHVLAAALRLNEAIALLPVEPLHSTCSHLDLPQKR